MPDCDPFIIFIFLGGGLGGPGGPWKGPGALGGHVGVTWLQDLVSLIFGLRPGGQREPCWAQVGGMLWPSRGLGFTLGFQW